MHILTYRTFKDMRLPDSVLIPEFTPILGFNNSREDPKGDIWLPVTVGRREDKTTVTIKFSVLNIASRYTCILGRRWIHAMRGVPSTYHQVFRYPGVNGTIELHGDQNAAQECHDIVKETPPVLSSTPKILEVDAPNRNTLSSFKNDIPTTSKGKEVDLTK